MALGSVATASPTSGLAGSSLEDFMRLLITQLQYQDPLSPMNNQEFMAQMAQFASMQQAQVMSANIASVVNIDAQSQAMALLGRHVSVLSSQGTVSGTVASLDFSGAEPLLGVTTTNGGSIPSVRMSQVIAVSP